MGLNLKLPKTVAFPLLVFLALGLAGLVWQLSGTFFARLEKRTVDLRFLNLPADASAADPDIVVVEIDEDSIQALEPAVGRWPWPREVHAAFLDYMKRAGARLVAFDIQFSERDLNNPESDRAFVQATAEAGNVLHVVAPQLQKLDRQPPAEMVGRFSIPAPDPPLPAELGFPQVSGPYEGLWEGARGLGHVAIALDPDGAMRRHLLLVQNQGRVYPSLSLAVALAAEGLSPSDLQIGGREVRAGRLRIPLDRDWRLPIWYNGGAGTYSPRWEAGGTRFRGYNYAKVLFSLQQITQGEEPLLPPARFAGKIVLVGLTAAGLHDLFTTPFSGGADESGGNLGKVAGVEIHAHVVDDLLHDRYLRPTPRWIDPLLAALLAAAAVAGVLYFRLPFAAGGAVAAVLLYLMAGQWAFAQRLQMPVVFPVMTWAAAFALGLGYQYWVEGREKRAVKLIFSRYVSKDVFQQLMDDPAAAELGGKRAEISVLFSDLRGFTSMSENRSPEAVISQLNEYFSGMVEVVFDCNGTIDKFVGDMIMALFSTPLPDPDHADHAVSCAIRMQRRLVEMNRDWAARGLPELHCGVGVNSGEMVAGNLGAESIRSYTVIGDNVNLGARLESLCKEYKSDIIISEFTLALLKHDYPMQELGDVLVKGKSKPVKIFRVFWEPDAVSLPKPEPRAETQPAHR